MYERVREGSCVDCTREGLGCEVWNEMGDREESREWEGWYSTFVFECACECARHGRGIESIPRLPSPFRLSLARSDDTFLFPQHPSRTFHLRCSLAPQSLMRVRVRVFGMGESTERPTDRLNWLVWVRIFFLCVFAYICMCVCVCVCVCVWVCVCYTVRGLRSLLGLECYRPWEIFLCTVRIKSEITAATNVRFCTNCIIGNAPK